MPDVVRVVRAAADPRVVRVVRDVGTVRVVRSDPLPPRVIVSRQGPPGPPGGAGTGGGSVPDVYAVSAASSWSHLHTFTYPPAVHIVDSINRAVDTDVEYPDATHVALTFPSPFTGTIILS